MIRAIAIDIDGTITEKTRVLNPISVETIRALRVPVVLATGNTHCFTRAAAVMLGIKHFIAENGGVISSNDRMEVLADRSRCDEAYERLHQAFGVEKFDSMYRMTDLVLIPGFDVPRASKYLDDLGIPVDLVDTGFAVHIKNRGITKGTGLARISEILDIPIEEFAAVGDSPSDIPMLEVAGFAAAVGNAHPEVKATADFVAESPFGMGFAEIVRHMAIEEML